MFTGYYTDSTGSDSCTACPEGNDCTNPDQTPTICPAGTYSPAATPACLSCPEGTILLI